MAAPVDMSQASLLNQEGPDAENLAFALNEEMNNPRFRAHAHNGGVYFGNFSDSDVSTDSSEDNSRATGREGNGGTSKPTNTRFSFSFSLSSS